MLKPTNDQVLNQILLKIYTIIFLIVFGCYNFSENIESRIIDFSSILE